MKWKFLKYVACAAVTLGLASIVRAGPITGSIEMNGSYSLNGVLTATAFTSFSGWTVDGGLLGPTGTFAGTAGDAVTMTPFTFKSFTGPLDPLWTFVAGGVTYSFDLTSVTGVAVLGAVVLSGNGWLTDGVAGDTTAGTWSFTGGLGKGGTLTIASAPASVPDGGATVVLLGVALSGLGFIRKKLA
jgi:hypothetical protein